MTRISKEDRNVKATVALSPSKSITNRAYIIRALSGIDFPITNVATAEDSVLLEKILNGIRPEIDVNDSGTAFRFLTAFLSIQPGSFILTGSDRMKQRPIGELVKALRFIGADIEYLDKENYPPLKITGRSLPGGVLSVDGSVSSQFISALLMIAPRLSNGLKIEMTGNVVSRPYIDMTISLMRYFGIEVVQNGNEIIISSQEYKGKELKVENDWSSASFWYQCAVLSDEAEITLKDLSMTSIQGDVVIDGIMNKFGVISVVSGNDIILRKRNESSEITFFEYDFSSCPDLVIPVAVVCTLLNITSELKGVRNLRIKESDRLSALKVELEKINANIILTDDSLVIKPSSIVKSKEFFHSHNDHRIVMALSFLALNFEEVNIDDQNPVVKSYPEFWRHLKHAGFEISNML